MTESESEIDYDELAERVAQKMDTGRVAEDRWLLTRRQLTTIAGSGLGLALLSGFGSRQVAAGTSQVGTIGTSSSRVDVQAEDVTASDTIETQNLIVNGNTTGVSGNGLTAGDNFDGQGTSQFSNISSINSDSLTVADDISVGSTATVTNLKQDGDDYTINNLTVNGTATGVKQNGDDFNGNGVSTFSNISSLQVDGTITENGTDDVLSSADGDFSVQKNGTDGTGVINFKT
jgi:hypothetical protein